MSKYRAPALGFVGFFSTFSLSVAVAEANFPQPYAFAMAFGLIGMFVVSWLADRSRPLVLQRLWVLDLVQFSL